MKRYRSVTPPEGASDGLPRHEATDLNTSAAPATDGGGWQKVEPSKKRRQVNPEPSSEAERLDEKSATKIDNAPTDSTISESNRQSSKPVDNGTKFSNPFSTSSTMGEDAPVNPFATTSDGRSYKPQKHTDRPKKAPKEPGFPAIVHTPSSRLTDMIRIADLQALVEYLLTDGHSVQWVTVKNRTDIQQVVVLMVPGLELQMFTGDLPLPMPLPKPATNVDPDASVENADMDITDAEDSRSRFLRLDRDDYYPVSLDRKRLPKALEPLADIFPHIWPIRGQLKRNGKLNNNVLSPVDQMLSSQIKKTREQREHKKSSNHKGPWPQDGKHFKNERTRITRFLMDAMEQRDNDITIHPACFSTQEARDSNEKRRKELKKSLDHGWVDTKVSNLKEGDVPEDQIEQGSLTAGRTVLTVDCEMCKTEDGKDSLTRVSIVDWNGNKILDELVKPDLAITDYVTQYSGIDKKMLEPVTTRLQDIQQKLLEIITPKTILMAHSLDSDLNALKLTHPFLVDTTVLYPHPRGPPYRQALRFISQRFLHRQIQNSSHGHDSIEDALACLDLVKQKCERGPLWGGAETNTEPIFKKLDRTTRPGASNTWRCGAVVDWDEPSRGFGAVAQVALGSRSDQEVVENIKLVLGQEASDKAGRTGKVDFVWGRLRELELARGWWNEAFGDTEKLRAEAMTRLGLSRVKPEADGPELTAIVSETVDKITKIWESLPRGTAFIVYTGTGDTREVRRLQGMHRTFRQEYQSKKWDDLTVKWTDGDDHDLSDACREARRGVGFMVVKGQ